MQCWKHSGHERWASDQELDRATSGSLEACTRAKIFKTNTGLKCSTCACKLQIWYQRKSLITRVGGGGGGVNSLLLWCQVPMRGMLYQGSALSSLHEQQLLLSQLFLLLHKKLLLLPQVHSLRLRHLFLQPLPHLFQLSLHFAYLFLHL